MRTGIKTAVRFSNGVYAKGERTTHNLLGGSASSTSRYDKKRSFPGHNMETPDRKRTRLITESGVTCVNCGKRLHKAQECVANKWELRAASWNRALKEAGIMKSKAAKWRSSSRIHKTSTYSKDEWQRTSDSPAVDHPPTPKKPTDENDTWHEGGVKLRS